MAHSPEVGGNSNGDDADAEHSPGPYNEGGNPLYDWFDEDGTLQPEFTFEGFDVHLREAAAERPDDSPADDGAPEEHQHDSSPDDNGPEAQPPQPEV